MKPWTFWCFWLAVFSLPPRAAAQNGPSFTVEQQEADFWLSGRDRPAVRLCAASALRDWVPVSWLRERVMAYVQTMPDTPLVEVLTSLLEPADVDRVTKSRPVDAVMLHGKTPRAVPADAYGRIPLQEMEDLELQGPVMATFRVSLRRPARVRITAAGGAPGTWCVNQTVLGLVSETQSAAAEMDLPAGDHSIGVIWSYLPRHPLLRIQGADEDAKGLLQRDLSQLPPGCPDKIGPIRPGERNPFRFRHQDAQEINHEAMAQCDLARGRLPDEDALLRFTPLDPHFRAKVALLRGENPAPWLPAKSAKTPWIAHENDLILAEHWMETRVTEPARIIWEKLAADATLSVRPHVRAAQLAVLRGLPASAARELMRLAEQHPKVPGIWRAAVEALDAAQMESFPAREQLLRLLPADAGEILVAAEILRLRGQTESAARWLEESWASLRDIVLLSAWHRLPGQEGRARAAASRFPWFSQWASRQPRIETTGYSTEGIPGWLEGSIPALPDFPDTQNRLDTSLPGAEILHLDQVLQIEPNGTSRYSRRVFLLVRDPRTLLEPFTVTYAPHSQNLRILQTRMHHIDKTLSARAASITSGELVEGPARMYFDLRVVRAAFPQPAPGDILEFWYVLEDLPAVRDGLAQASFGHILPMQERFRIAAQRLRILPPPGVELKHRLSREAGVQMKSGITGKQPWLEFHARGVEAWRNEPGAPGWGETLLTLQLGTARGWKEIGSAYGRFIGPLYRLRPAWRELAQKIAGSARTDVERIQAVHAWVQRNFRYVSMMFGEHGYLPYSVEEILERRFGDCKDMTLLLVVLLQSLGIDARPAIVRTRDMGDLPLDVPSLAPFNHSVVHLPAYGGWIDGTVKGLLFPLVPAWIQGRRALVISPEGGELVTVPADAADANRDAYDFTLSVRDDRSAELAGRVHVRGQAEAAWRQFLEGDSRGSLQRLLQRIWPGAALASWAAPESANLSSPLELRFSLRIPEIVQKRARGFVLPLDFGSETELSRLISNPVRRCDFQLDYPFTREWNASIQLNRSWCVAAMPRPAEWSTPQMSFRQAFSCEKRRCRLERRLQIHAARVAAAEYPVFVDALNRALLAMHEELVLSRCGP